MPDWITHGIFKQFNNYTSYKDTMNTTSDTQLAKLILAVQFKLENYHDF